MQSVVEVRVSAQRPHLQPQKDYIVHVYVPMREGRDWRPQLDETEAAPLAPHPLEARERVLLPKRRFVERKLRGGVLDADLHVG